MERSDVLKKLIAELDGDNLRLNVNPVRSDSAQIGDEIFHLPSISFCILVLTAIRSFKLKVPETGHFVASVLQEAVAGVKNSQSDLRWSFRLRAVCADALEFLERMEMINVNSQREVNPTPTGKTFLDRSTAAETSLGMFRTGIIRGLDKVIARGDRLL